MHSDWFKSWFDSPYYHLLYSHRDENEAEFFLTRLMDELKIPVGAKVLDLACGKGRHAIFLHKKGLDVSGVDLSPNNIREANTFSNEKLRFHIGDMREVLKGEKFNYILNLFTSFGYFDEDEDNLKVLRSVHEMLEPGGIFILDFLNVTKLKGELCVEESKKMNEIVFNISRHSCDRFIQKEIRFEDKDQSYCFTEKVRFLDFSTLEKMLNATQLQIITTFGSYSLSPFDEKTSDRLIIIAKKN
jgi:2-polyprenyl-3-methyl-5-hydroxy-6-metoxy-1,4-benzoquinol methylase